MRFAGLQFLLFASLSLTGAVAVPVHAALSPEEIYAKISPSVLTLQIENSKRERFVGSAFLALRPGLAVTAWHVVHDAQKIEAWFPGQPAKIVGLVAKDEKLDLALLEIEARDRVQTVLATNKPRVGAKAFVIGTPKGMDFSLADGLISQIRELDGMCQYQLSCPIHPGNSGGPVLNDRGEVVGVVSWRKAGLENLSFAVPSTDVFRLDASRPAVPWPAVQLIGSDPASVNTPLNGERVKSDLPGLAEFQEALGQFAGKKVKLTLENGDSVQSFIFEAPRPEQAAPALQKK